MNWDDLKLYLALVRAGNVRRAGEQIGVSHSTVARRIDQLEATLGVTLLERLPSGYALTNAGEEMLHAAEQVERELDAVERRVLGQDRQLAGPIVVTMVDVFATHLLMPAIKEFAARYPNIDIDLQISYVSVDLRKREADIALRVTQSPPDFLIGRKVGTMAHAGYATRDYVDNHDLTDPASANWLGFRDEGRSPKWVKDTRYPNIPARGVYESLALQLEATRQGVGLGYLPCFLGDADPTLIRVDEPENFPAYDLWLLRHADTRETARLRVFADCLANEMNRHSDLLLGERPLSN
ncbi:MAG: LysR family transcriptional regulator [Pseudomonadota bacterium]